MPAIKHSLVDFPSTAVHALRALGTIPVITERHRLTSPIASTSPTAKYSVLKCQSSTPTSPASPNHPSQESTMVHRPRMSRSISRCHALPCHMRSDGPDLSIQNMFCLWKTHTRSLSPCTRCRISYKLLQMLGMSTNTFPSMLSLNPDRIVVILLPPSSSQ